MDVDGERLLRALTEAGFEFVVIGGTAALAHGASTPTLDLDVAAPMTEANLARLLQALAPYQPRHASRPDLGVIWQSPVDRGQGPSAPSQRQDRRSRASLDSRSPNTGPR